MKLSRLAALWHLPFQNVLTASSSAGSSVSISSEVPSGAAVVPRDLISFSIEYRHLPKFTGSLSEPNEFSQNLLDNLNKLTGTYPIIRVGGGSQDFAWFNSSQSAPEVDVPDVPSGQKGSGPTASISEQYFDSFKVWSNLRFIVGLNIAFYNDDGITNLQKMTKYTCQALGDRLVMWENGNEPDLLPNWGQRSSSDWDIPTYVKQWKDFSSRIIDQAKKSCGDSYDRPFYGPSIATASNDPDGFTDVAAFNAGINDEPKTPIAQIATHSYMGIGGDASLSTIMSHSKVKTAIAKHLELQADLAKYGLPFTIGEGNSLTGGGQAGVSDAFGAALWAADYSLYVASNADRITRTHFHQSYNAEKGSPYNAWKPISDDLGSPSTNAPYYGHLLAAKTIGSEDRGRIYEVPLSGTDGLDSMYVAYDSTGPKRITIINLAEWSGSGTRASRKYTVKLPSADFTTKVGRLQGPSADAKSGITFGGSSYGYDSRGKPQPASDSIREASAGGVSQDGDTLTVDVPDSEAVLITLYSSYSSDSATSESSSEGTKREFSNYGRGEYKCLPVHAPRQDDLPSGWIDCSKA